MLCDQCRDHKAAVNLTTVRDDDVNSTYLCVSCARREGLDTAARRAPPFAEMVADLEQRDDPAQITRFLSWIERHEREHPDVPLPPEAAAFRARHTA